MTKELAALNIINDSHVQLLKHGLTIKVDHNVPYYSYNIKVFKFTPCMNMSKKLSGWDIYNLIKQNVEGLKDIINGAHSLGFYIKCAVYRNHIEFSF